MQTPPPAKSRTAPWQGIRRRPVDAAPDPESAPIAVTLPVSWGESAAAALASLLPDRRAIDLVEAADRWIAPIAAADPALGPALHALLAARRGAATESFWMGAPAQTPGFLLALPAFHDPETGFDIAGFGAAAEVAVAALTAAAPEAPNLAIGITGLAALLARLGLDYDSAEAASVAGGIAGLLAAHTDRASHRLLARGSAGTRIDAAMPPADTAIAGLRAATLAVRAELSAGVTTPKRRHRGLTAIVRSPIEALLGAETSGIAPPLTPLADDGTLAPWARALLAAKRIAPEQALAAALAGAPLFPQASPAALSAIHAAVAPHLHDLPTAPTRPLPAPRPAAARATQHAPLPARRAGYTQKATVGGHKLYLRTGDYADGRLGEISIALAKESPAFRGLMEAFAIAVSTGLQHGVPLDAFAASLIGTSFGPAGAVEGDDHVAQASSLVDYAFRHLAANYLGQTSLPEPALPEAAAEDHAPAADSRPLLPLDLPPQPSRAPLRLVSAR